MTAKKSSRKPPAKKKPRTLKKPEKAQTPEVDVITAEQQQLVEDACSHITSTLERTLFKGMIEVGQYVLKTFFDNDPKVARSRSRKKGASFRLLTDRCDTDALPVGKSWLFNAVGLAIKDVELEGKSDAYAQLTPTHKVKLLPVKNPEDVDQLAQQVLEEGLTTRQLQERVSGIVAEQPRGPGGRKPKKVLLKTLDDAVKPFMQDSRVRPVRKADVDELDEKEAKTALQSARKLAKQIEQMVNKLEARLQEK